MHASRWISYKALLSPRELREMISGSGCEPVDVGRISAEPFDLEGWFAEYQALYEGAAGRLPVIGLHCDPSSIEELEVSGGKQMTRPVKPVILVGPCTYRIGADNKIFTNVLGDDAHFWGVDVRYPALFQPKNSGKALNILGNPEFPNGKAFRDVAKWLRKKTRPVSFAGITSDLRTGVDNAHRDLVHR